MLLSLMSDVWRKTFNPPLQEGTVRRHCLTFALNGIRLGIDTRVVNEIARYRILSEPRGMPGFIRGLFQHHGVMVPVIDIASCYGKHPLRPGGRTCIVLVNLGEGKWRCNIGIMVDEIFGVSEFESSELLSVPEAAHRMLQVEIIEGLLKQKQGYLIVIDALRLLPDEELEKLTAFIRALRQQ